MASELSGPASPSPVNIATTSSLTSLPSLTSIEKQQDHLMSSLGFPTYGSLASSSSAVAANSLNRKFNEGNATSGTGNNMSTASNSYVEPHHHHHHSHQSSSAVSAAAAAAAVSASTPYPYFTSPTADLYSGSYGTSTGVFSSKTLQPSRPRNKSRANAGEREKKYQNTALSGGGIASFANDFLGAQDHIYVKRAGPACLTKLRACALNWQLQCSVGIAP